MSDHLTQNQIVYYGRRPLPPAEWIIISDHLANCESCRLRIEEVVDNEATYLSLKSGVFDEMAAGAPDAGLSHPTFEKMAGFVDETLANGELQAFKEHLALCEECHAAVDDLRAFKAQIAPEIEQAGRLAQKGAATESGWRRLVAEITSFRFQSPALAFGSALAVLLLAIGWLALQGLTGMKSKPEVAITNPAPGASPSTAPPAMSGSAAEIIARLKDGAGQITLNKEGRMSGVDHLPAAYQRMIKKALTDQKIDRSPVLAELTPPGVRSRGVINSSGKGDAQSAKFSVIEPVGVVTQSDRPTFHWMRLEGATGYVVEVYDEWFNPLVRSPQITDHSWTATRSLKRGAIYYWLVKAIKDGQEFKAPRPPAPQAKFRILDEATADELSKARRAYASSRLTLGLLYAQAGLLNEAEVEFQALSKNNPDSELGRRLLKQLRTKP